MAIILGLDVSTSVTGICILNTNEKFEDKDLYISRIAALDLSKHKTMWEKADNVAECFKSLEQEHCIDRIVLEEPLMGFRPGMSSAQTISTLMRFNGIVSYIARNTFCKEPEYIGSAHARKLCGIKLQRTGIAGPQKEQVFKYMAEHDLSHIVWPVKKSGKTVDWSRDACDAYVIAQAAAINGPVLPPTKKVKKIVLAPSVSCAWTDCNSKPMRNLTMCKKHQPFPA